MPDPDPDTVTRVLADAAAGDSRAAGELLPMVYDQLRKIAQERMNQERVGHTLQATALVHEAYVRLVGSREVAWANRAHFFHAAAESMRRILIDHARSAARVKRGGDGSGKRPVHVPLNVVDLAAADNPDEIVAVDDAIRRLEESDATAASVVRLRFYAGLGVEETAAALGISERTVMREWSYAKAVLFRELEKRRELEAEKD